MLTIVTPTYNREKLLVNCYNSLIQQTNKNFIWMIVDDGSKDGTEECVKEWQFENIIQIKYFKKKNGGKASALNVALSNIETKYVCCLDSDDTFFPETVETVLNQLKEIECDETCCGILALRTKPEGGVMGGREIPKNYTQVTAADVFLKLALRTEVICFYKSSIITQYRFPEFPGEKFVSPSWMQYTLTQNYKFKTSWDRLCVCEYVADGLTRNKKRVIVNNPHGYTEIKRLGFELSPNFKLMIKNGIMYDCGCILGRDKYWLKNAPRKLWAIILYPVAYIVKYLRFSDVL